MGNQADRSGLPIDKLIDRVDEVGIELLLLAVAEIFIAEAGDAGSAFSERFSWIHTQTELVHNPRELHFSGLIGYWVLQRGHVDGDQTELRYFW